MNDCFMTVEQFYGYWTPFLMVSQVTVMWYVGPKLLIHGTKYSMLLPAERCKSVSKTTQGKIVCV